VPARPADNDVDNVGGGAGETGAAGDRSRRQFGGDVQSQGEVGLAESFVEPVVEHRLRAEYPLLGRLANQQDRAPPPVAVFR
jgi:hypothetical protein